MRIIAYSKVPSAVPFVHLGYLAASTTTTKPIPGLLVSGTILLIAGVALGGKWLWRRRKSPEPTRTEGLRTPRRVVVAFALLLPSVLAFKAAYVFGEKETFYAHPKEATLDHIWVLDQHVAKSRESDNNGDQAAVLLTQEGEYDASTVVSVPESAKRLFRQRRLCFDGWNMPLKVRVTRQNGELRYAVVSGGPDRIVGTPDDITSANARDD